MKFHEPGSSNGWDYPEELWRSSIFRQGPYGDTPLKIKVQHLSLSFNNFFNVEMWISLIPIRFFKLHNTGLCEVLPMTVPRKVWVMFSFKNHWKFPILYPSGIYSEDKNRKMIRMSQLSIVIFFCNYKYKGEWEWCISNNHKGGLSIRMNDMIGWQTIYWLLEREKWGKMEDLVLKDFERREFVPFLSMGITNIFRTGNIS